MAIKSNKAKKEKTKKVKSKATTKGKKDKGPSRKDFILGLVEKAGAKGISKSALVKKTDEEFRYDSDKSSRLRVGNTIKKAEEAKIVTVSDGIVTWK